MLGLRAEGDATLCMQHCKGLRPLQVLRYTKVAAPNLIEYEFGRRVGLVEFAEGPSGVTVKVTFDAEETHSKEQQRAGWQAILDSFGRHALACQGKK